MTTIIDKSWRVVASCNTLSQCRHAREYLRIAHKRVLDQWRKGCDTARKEVHLIDKIGEALLVREEIIYQHARRGHIEDGAP